MTEGLITRLGRWMDHHWESKATESMVLERWNILENHQIADKLELQERIKEIKRTIQEIVDMVKTPSDSAKELAELKTRIEKIELYAGMTRKVDPTKPPVARSAFSM